MGHIHSRDVDDRRRADELDKSAKGKLLNDIPSVGQLTDGEKVAVRGGRLAWREGNDVWWVQGTRA